jgi:two-component system, sensor histidine kinase YesM
LEYLNNGMNGRKRGKNYTYFYYFENYKFLDYNSINFEFLERSFALRFIHSIYVKILLSFLMISIIPLSVASLVSYTKISNNMHDELNGKANMILNQNVKTLNFFMKDIERMEKMISTQSLISDFLTHNEKDQKYYQYFLKLDPFINSIETIRPENVGITIINDANLVYFYGYSMNQNNNNFQAFNWLPAPKNLLHSPIFTTLHKRDYANNESSEVVFSYIKKIWSKDLKSYGLLIIDFKLSVFQQLFSNISEQESLNLLLMDQNENILFSTDPLKYRDLRMNQLNVDRSNNSVKYQNTTYYYIPLKLPGTNWQIISFFEQKSLYSSLLEAKRIVIIIMAVTLLSCIIISLFISYKLANPIKRLLQLMKLVQEGDFKQKIHTNRKDEIGELGRGFNQMVIRISQLVKKLYFEQEEKKRTEIMALQAQINPHFLYNTLELINSLARKNEQYEISKLIALLGKLLRFSISTFEEFVRLDSEIGYAKSYLEINKIRFRNSFDYQIEICDDISNFLTIKWILQPIIENAIIHGINKNMDGSMIVLSCWTEGNDVYFNVTDNGVGMESAKCEELQANLEHHANLHTKNNKNIGLYNVQSRIRLTFGDQYGVKISSVLDKGTTVIVKIPRRENHD